MQWLVVGLGNPGGEYERTRHNVGRDIVRALAKKEGVGEFTEHTKSNALIAKGELFGVKATLILPDTYMNNSGKALGAFVASKNDARKVVVIQDELDLPLGKVKCSFGNSSGGHRGIESIQKALKTKDFIRVRVGISRSTPSGKVKKPLSDDTADFVLGKFTPLEQEKLKKVHKVVAHALEIILTDGLEKAQTVIHAQ